jgi:hypothetical protein
VFSGRKQKTQQPPMQNEMGKKIHEAFEELLKTAAARKQTFLVGVAEQLNENGAQKRPLMNFRAFVDRFFDGTRYETGKLGLAQTTGLPLGRVVVHPEDVHTMKLRVRDGWREAKDIGWWVGQESPADLRQMETNAFRFVMETKTMCEKLRRFYLEVDDGFLRYQGAPFLPVYMIPADKNLWQDLAEVLFKMVESLRSVSWVDRFRVGLRKLEPFLLDEWNGIIKFKDGGAEKASRRREADEMTALSKLNTFGRAPRYASKSNLPPKPSNSSSHAIRSLSTDTVSADVVSSISVLLEGTGTTAGDDNSDTAANNGTPGTVLGEVDLVNGPGMADHGAVEKTDSNATPGNPVPDNEEQMDVESGEDVNEDRGEDFASFNDGGTGEVLF